MGDNDEMFEELDDSEELEQKASTIALGSDSGIELAQNEAQSVLDTMASPGWKHLERMFEADRNDRAFSFLTKPERGTGDRLEELGIVEGAVGYAAAMLNLRDETQEDFEQTFTKGDNNS